MQLARKQTFFNGVQPQLVMLSPAAVTHLTLTINNMNLRLAKRYSCVTKFSLGLLLFLILWCESELNDFTSCCDEALASMFVLSLSFFLSQLPAQRPGCCTLYIFILKVFGSLGRNSRPALMESLFFFILSMQMFIPA